MTRDELRELLWGSYDKRSLELFKKYNNDHPDIYDRFRKYADKMRQTGRKKYSAKCIMERIRWDHDIKHTDSDFKISNSMTSFYVRLLIWDQNDYLGFFQVKKVKGIRPISKKVADKNIVIDFGDVM